MDSEEIEKWDEESERAWREDNHEVEFPDAVKVMLLEILPMKAKILDGGCGVGKHVGAFRKLGYEVVGIDQSKKAVEYAKQLNPDSHIIHMRIQDLTFCDHFDLIHTSAVLQHSTHERKQAILRNFYRALKPKGYLLSTECTFTPGTVKTLKEKVLKIPYLGWSEDWSDGYSFSEKGWIKFMVENRFRHITTIPPFPYYLFQVYK